MTDINKKHDVDHVLLRQSIVYLSINMTYTHSCDSGGKWENNQITKQMENHTPQKRHQAIISFSRDHHFGLLLVWKIRQGLNKAVNPERISNYVTFFFKEDLEKHFKEEERLLFSKLPVGDVLRKKAEADHLAIYKLIVTIEKKNDDATLLSQLANELEKHIRFEERE